jgi:hypothetical protein
MKRSLIRRKPLTESAKTPTVTPAQTRIRQSVSFTPRAVHQRHLVIASTVLLRTHLAKEEAVNAGTQSIARACATPQLDNYYLCY